jgi:hypothetical protein
MVESNSAGKSKLKYEDIRDLILREEVRIRDVGETSSSGSTLHFETRGRGKQFQFKSRRHMVWRTSVRYKRCRVLLSSLESALQKIFQANIRRIIMVPHIQSLWPVTSSMIVR